MEDTYKITIKGFPEGIGPRQVLREEEWGDLLTAIQLATEMAMGYARDEKWRHRDVTVYVTVENAEGSWNRLTIPLDEVEL